jgi:probable rRNA maturation factor
MSIIINIFNESSRKRIPRKKIILSLKKLFSMEGYDTATINIIFIDDIAIKELNKQYLKHNYTTDVISFCLEKEPLEGEVYISVETAEVNSKEYKTSWTAEIIRYAIHGVLHIIGYDDYSLEEREKNA